MHDRRANLNVGRAKQQEFNRVAPCVDSSDAGDRDRKFLIARKLRDHIERYRLYGSAAISSVGCHAVHVWIRDHRIDIDAHY